MARILIAEHNLSVTEYLQARLKKAGHVVDAVDNCLDTWRLSARGGYDFLLINIVMPGIDGFILAQKALQENPDLQVIFITGFAGVAMDLVLTPSYSPAPITTAPFHLSEINQRISHIMGLAPLASARKNSSGTDNVIYAHFGQSESDSLQQSF